MPRPINSSEPRDQQQGVSPMMIRREGPPQGSPGMLEPPSPIGPSMAGAPGSGPMGPGTQMPGPGTGMMGGGNELAQILAQALQVINRDGFSAEHAMTLADFGATLQAITGVGTDQPQETLGAAGQASPTSQGTPGGEAETPNP